MKRPTTRCFFSKMISRNPLYSEMLTMAPVMRNVTPLTGVSLEAEDGHVRTTLTPAMRLVSSGGVSASSFAVVDAMVVGVFFIGFVAWKFHVGYQLFVSKVESAKKRCESLNPLWYLRLKLDTLHVRVH